MAVLVDADGRVLGAALVQVAAAEAPLVTVQRGPDSRQTYACTPTCAPTAGLGDTSEAFQGLAGEMQTRQALSLPLDRDHIPPSGLSGAAGR